MDLDCGIKAAGHGRWSKWWAEARSLAKRPTTASQHDADRGSPDRPGEANLALAEELTSGLIAEEFLTLLSCSRAYVLLMNASYKILAANQSFRDSQIAADDPTGSNFIELLDAESQLRARLLLETMADRPCVIELAHRTQTETTRQITYSFCRTGDCGQSRIIAVGRDQEDPLELVEQLVQLDTEFEESRYGLNPDDTTDISTGLGNRRRLFERLDALWREASSQGTLVWVMMADVDQFRTINQAFGHEAGDEVLEAIARKLHNSVRAGDWVCRYGGDGFLLAGVCTDESEMPGLAGRLLRAVRGLRFDVAGKTPRLTISLGAALAYPSEPCQPWVVLQRGRPGDPSSQGRRTRPL